MRIGVAQINPVLGDFKTNKEKILRFLGEAAEKRCSLVVFPECTLFGYHPFDLLERRTLVDQQLKELKDLHKKIPAEMAALVGVITPNPEKLGKPYYNTVALLVRGKPIQYFHKTLLPTGDVFDEARFIECGDMKKNFFSWKGKKFFLTICEDIWAWPDARGKSLYKKNPLKAVEKKKIDLVINMSASPWHLGKMKKRVEVTRQTAALFKAPLLYVNITGAQDEIIFDGQSFLIDGKGKKHVSCLAFQEDLNVFDLNTRESWTPPVSLDPIEELRRGLVLGVRDFCAKTGLKKAHLGLSGGIDSALVACLAADALGPQNVSTFAMPGPFSAPESLALAQELAKNLGVRFESLEIGPLYQVVGKLLADKLGIKEFGLVHENLQSRLRGLLMMAISNNEQSLLLTTGNKSEYATGYATLYGDMCGGLAPIGDLTKDQVYALSKHYNLEGELIPDAIIAREPSAELKPNQKDSDALPEYEILDQAVRHLVEEGKDAKGQTERWLMSQLFKTEFKRWQAAPILKVSAHAFGRGRRFPVAHRAHE